MKMPWYLNLEVLRIAGMRQDWCMREGFIKECYGAVLSDQVKCFVDGCRGRDGAWLWWVFVVDAFSFGLESSSRLSRSRKLEVQPEMDAGLDVRPKLKCLRQHFFLRLT